jgi:hypothetical protein
VSRLTNGPVGVINLIARRGMAGIGLRVLWPGMECEAGSGLHVIHAPLSGAAVLDIDGNTETLPPDHGLRLEGATRITCREGPAILATIHRSPPS